MNSLFKNKVGIFFQKKIQEIYVEPWQLVFLIDMDLAAEKLNRAEHSETLIYKHFQRSLAPRESPNKQDPASNFTLGFTQTFILKDPPFEKIADYIHNQVYESFLRDTTIVSRNFSILRSQYEGTRKKLCSDPDLQGVRVKRCRLLAIDIEWLKRSPTSFCFCMCFGH